MHIRFSNKCDKEQSMVSLRKETKGLASAKTNYQLEILLLVFNTILAFVAISGLAGIMVFAVVHWARFS